MSTGTPSDPSGPPADADPEAAHLLATLQALAGAVVGGSMTRPAAREELLRRIDPAKLDFLTLYHAALLQHLPGQPWSAIAEIRAELIYEAAQRWPGEDADLLRAECAYVLGVVILDRARASGEGLAAGPAYRGGPDAREAYERARPYLEEAFRVRGAEDDQQARVEAATIAVHLGVCARGLRQLPAAARRFQEAISRWERIVREGPEDRHLADVAVTNLAVAYGNLADVQEAMGDREATARAYYEVATRFADAGDFSEARRALFLLAGACEQLGRFDQALAAVDHLHALLQQGGDVEAMVRIDLDLARLAMRVNPGRGEVALLDRAERLLQPLLVLEDDRRHAMERLGQPLGALAGRGRALLALRAELLMLRGHALAVLYHREPSGAVRARAYAALAEARTAAEGAGDPNLLGAVLFEVAYLGMATKDFDAAEEAVRLIDGVPCSPVWRDRAAVLLGKVRLQQGRYQEALPLLTRASEAGDVGHLNAAVAQFAIGKAYLGAEDYPAALAAFERAVTVFERGRGELLEESGERTREVVEDFYAHLIVLSSTRASGVPDAVRAWEWVERAKCRTMVEELGLSDLPLPHAPTAAAALLDRESALLRQLRALRTEVAAAAPHIPARLGLLDRRRRVEDELERIWEQLARKAPEYVGLRTGRTASWDDIQEIFAWETDPPDLRAG